MGWGVVGSGADAELQHDGSVFGFTARILASPAEHWGIVVLANRGDAAPFLEAVARYVTAVLHAGERPADDDLVAADQAQQTRLDQALAATVPISADAVAPFVGKYDDGVRVSARGMDLMIDLGYGEMPFRTIPGSADTFVGVGGVLSLLGVQFDSGPGGVVLLRIGNLDPNGEIPYGIEVERQTPRSQCP